MGYATFTPQIGDWFYDQCAVLWRKQYPDDRGDLSTMRALGVNHLRTYFWWHWQYPQEGATDWILSKGWTKPGAPTFDHKPFLDECAKNGIYVVIGLAVDSGDIFEGPEKNRPAYRALYVDTARKIGELYGKHPAVIGLCVGNEQNQPTATRNRNPDFWVGLAEMGNAFKANAPDKITMIAFQNDAALFDTVVGGKPLPEVFKESFDVYGLNIYGDLTPTLANFQAKVITANQGAYALPLIVSEWGVGGGVNYENPKYADPGFGFPKTRQTPDHKTIPIGPLEGPPYGIALSRECNADELASRSATLARYHGQMVANKSFVVGGEYFAWSDEWWKNTTDQAIIDAIDRKELPLDQWGRYKFPYPPAQGAFIEYRIPTRVTDQDASASPEWPEEWWGLFSIARNKNGPIGWNQYGMYNPDQLTARTPLVDALTKAFAAT